VPDILKLKLLMLPSRAMLMRLRGVKMHGAAPIPVPTRYGKIKKKNDTF
jgi:hypothetical protein